MKKNIVYIAAIAMALFSCSKDRQGQTNTQPDSNETKRPEALSDLDPEKYLVSFGASLEGVGDHRFHLSGPLRKRVQRQCKRVRRHP